MTVRLSPLLSRLAEAPVRVRGQEPVLVAAPISAFTSRCVLHLSLALVSVALAGCTGSVVRDVADASNRPGGVFAVVPCRYSPDISGALRTTVTGSDKRKKCNASWTHPTASQDQLVEDMKACSKDAFWVLSPSAAQDRRLECMEAKGYRRDIPHNASSPGVAEPQSNLPEADKAVTAAAPPQTQQTPMPPEREADEAAVTSVLDTVMHALNNGDLNRLLDQFADDARIDSKAAGGKVSKRSYQEAMAAAFTRRNVPLVRHSYGSIVIGDTAATINGTVQLGERLLPNEWRLEKRAGRWVIVETLYK